MNDFGDAEGFIYALTVRSDVDHVRLDAKDRQQDKCEVVVGRDEDLRARIPCILGD